MPDPRRLLVLALDAASADRLLRWAEEGSLPAVAALLARGRRASTRSVEGVYVGATWPSFSMGVGPGHHGLYWLDPVLPGTYRRQRADGDALAPLPTLWEVLSAAGRTTAVLDVPLRGLSSRVRGPQVVEWGVHDAVFGFQALPRGLAAEIEARHGRHPAPPLCDAVRSPRELEAFAEQLETGAAARADLTLDLLERNAEWSFAIQVFSETHCAGHQLWHTHDPDHPGHDPSGEDLLHRVYRAVDGAVGRIVDGVGPETTVALVALHGMGPAGGHSLLLEPVLRRLGVQAREGGDSPAPAAAAATGAEPGRPSATELLRAVYRAVVPEGLRERWYLARQRRNQARGRGTPLDLDPTRTRAFAVGLGTGPPFSAIRLNLRGREPRGVLSPGAEAEAFVEELTAELRALVDPRTGQPAVARIVRSREVFEGPRVGHLPDLLVEWTMWPPRGTEAVGKGAGALWEVESPRVGRLSARNRYCRTGEHRPEGLAVVAGPGIEAGEVGRTLSIVELAPTFAAILGVDTPSMSHPAAPEFIPVSGS